MTTNLTAEESHEQIRKDMKLLVAETMILEEYLVREVNAKGDLFPSDDAVLVAAAILQGAKIIADNMVAR